MRVKLPEFASKAEAFTYLRTNKKSLIDQKRSMPIKSDIYDWGVMPFEQGTQAKSDGSQMGPNEIEVDHIANLAGWCDSYMDVMIKDSWKNTITSRAIVYHLKDHDYETEAIVAKDPELYTKMFDISYFGITSDVQKAQALMMRSTVMKDYDEKTFYLYRDGQIKQHSIGLRYIIIKLCMDSNVEEDKEYKDNWDKYYPQVINKDKVDAKGYFWAVVEAKIFESSCVLFGANEMTPVYASTVKDTDPADEAVEKTEPPITPSTENKSFYSHLI